MLIVFAGRDKAVMTSAAIPEDAVVSKAHLGPAANIVAVIALVTARNMIRRSAFSQHVVVATEARAPDFKVVNTPYRRPAAGHGGHMAGLAVIAAEYMSRAFSGRGAYALGAVAAAAGTPGALENSEQMTAFAGGEPVDRCEFESGFGEMVEVAQALCFGGDQRAA